MSITIFFTWHLTFYFFLSSSPFSCPVSLFHLIFFLISLCALFIDWFVRSFVLSSVLSFIHLFLHSVIYPFFHSFSQPFICLSIYLFSYLFIIYLFVLCLLDATLWVRSRITKLRKRHWRQPNASTISVFFAHSAHSFLEAFFFCSASSFLGSNPVILFRQKRATGTDQLQEHKSFCLNPRFVSSNSIPI